MEVHYVVEVGVRMVFTAILDEFERLDGQTSNPKPYLNLVLGPMLEEKLRKFIKPQINEAQSSEKAVQATFSLGNDVSYTTHRLANDQYLSYKVSVSYERKVSHDSF
jgi:hypothetical protein